jgi:hypothetical protein
MIESHNTDTVSHSTIIPFNKDTDKFQSWGFAYLLYPEPVKKPATIKMVLATTYINEYPDEMTKKHENWLQMKLDSLNKSISLK